MGVVELWGVPEGLFGILSSRDDYRQNLNRGVRTRDSYPSTSCQRDGYLRALGTYELKPDRSNDETTRSSVVPISWGSPIVGHPRGVTTIIVVAFPPGFPL